MTRREPRLRRTGPWQRSLWRSTRRGACCVAAVGLFAAPALALPKLPPAPEAILGLALPRTPPIRLETGCRRVAARATRDRGDSAALGRALQRLLQADAGRAQLRAREAIRSAALGAVPSPGLVCSWLELAQVELALGLFPEAAVSALRGEALAGSADEPELRREQASFLRAEAELLAGYLDRASERYRALAASQRPELREAVTLRDADIHTQRGELAAAFPAYRALLESGTPTGASARAWRGRAVEAAIAAGHLDLASLWLRQRVAELSGDAERARALLRFADLRSEQHRPHDARSALAEVYALRRGEAEGWLALIRVYDLEIEITGPENSLGTLRGAIREASQPNLVRYAQIVLSRRLIAAGEFERGLRLLLGAHQDRQSAATAALAHAELPEAIATITEKSECRPLLEVLGARQNTIAEVVRAPGPLLQIGACYEELSLFETAIGVYRGAVKRLGPEHALPFALPLARANLAAGRVTSARVAALRATQTPGSATEWYRILAAARLASNEPETAISGLLALAKERGAESLGAAELEILAQASAHLPDSPELRRLLHSRLRELDRASKGGPREEIGLAALLAARRWRMAGGRREAAELYALAFRSLPDAAPRSQAGYWAGRLGAEPEAARAQLVATAALAASPFTKLAAREIELRDLRAQLGLPEAGGL